MRSAKWIFATGLILMCAAFAHADDINPPDGIIGVKGGSGSTQITSLSFPLTFVSCAGATGSTLADCDLFGSGPDAPQEVFAGINDTGMAWDALSIELTLPTWTAGNVLTCDGGSFFSINNCAAISSELVVGNTPQTVTINFMQGSGNGIGCYDTINTNVAAIKGNAGCFLSSVKNYNFGSPTGLYDNPFGAPCGNTLDEVCGGSDFVLGLGYGGAAQAFPSLPVGDGAGANGASIPEPSSLLLLFAGLAAVLGLRFLRFTRGKIITA